MFRRSFWQIIHRWIFMNVSLQRDEVVNYSNWLKRLTFNLSQILLLHNTNILWDKSVNLETLRQFEV